MNGNGKKYARFWNRRNVKLKVFKVFKKHSTTHIENFPMIMEYGNFTISINKKWFLDNQSERSLLIRSVRSKSLCLKDTEIEEDLNFQKSNKYIEIGSY